MSAPAASSPGNSDLLFLRLSAWLPFPFLLLEALSFTFLSPKFNAIYQDMLGGRPLPLLSTFVLGHSAWFFLLPLASLGLAILLTAVFKPTVGQTVFYVLTALVAGLIAAAIFLFGAFIPMIAIITSMRQ